MNPLINKLKKITYKQKVVSVILAFCFIVSIVFVQHNYSFYDHPIAKVVHTNLVDTHEIDDMFRNKDRLFSQSITAQIKNGKEKDKLIHLTNKYSSSGAYDQAYHVGDELFILMDQNKQENTALTGVIKGVKRDQHIVMGAWIFIFILLLVGKKQGLYTLISLAVNAAVISYALDIYVKNPNSNLLWICAVMVVLFTFISMLLVNGVNEKTYSAIIATLIGTFAALFITYLVLRLTSETGLRYEEMQFLTRPYKLVFIAGLLIGSLGAVMDVAITISSFIFGLYDKNNDISVKALRASGMEIGKDIMGPITNILFFAYISGSIPMLILYLKNGSPLGFTLSMNLSLELARALAGGIGVVLTIPIGLYTSIFFISRKKARL